jgi:hypothetical protein
MFLQYIIILLSYLSLVPFFSLGIRLTFVFLFVHVAAAGYPTSIELLNTNLLG